MLYPADYTPNTTNYDTILQKLAAFYGIACVELGRTNEPIDPDHLLEAYGINIDDPAYGLSLIHISSVLTPAKLSRYATLSALWDLTIR